MKKEILNPQVSDMGEGFGVYHFKDGEKLHDFLDWYYHNSLTWGVITVYNKNNQILRKFDYDLYNKEIFYHHFSGWEYDLSLKKIEFSYCFMCEDVDIYLGD